MVGKGKLSHCCQVGSHSSLDLALQNIMCFKDVAMNRFMELISTDSQVVYSFGGRSPSEDRLKKVYRYTRADDRWTEMPEMPTAQGGAMANCAKVMFRSRDVVLCFGTVKDDGKMFSFDLATETWEDVGITAPTPPNYLSVLFVAGDHLYRYDNAGLMLLWHSCVAKGPLRLPYKTL